MRNGDNAISIFLAGVRSVLPEKLVTDTLKLRGQVLVAGSHELSLGGIEKIWVIGAGKASAAMGHYVECVLGDRITGGHIVVKYGHSCQLKKIRVTEAGHPIPDENSFMAAREITEIASAASADDLVICLISGGASALLSDLPGGLLPEELYIVNNLLVRSGATISEINCVRKHLSSLKGGQLARTIRPARLITLIISDVIGNQPEVIGSGPTVPDTTTFADALAVIEKYKLTGDVTRGTLNYLRDGCAGYHPDTPRPGDIIFEGTLNVIAGTNQIALRACKNEAIKLGYRTYIIDTALEGDVETVCESIINTALSFRNNQDIPKPACLLYGGETTVRVTGSGTGGRNQHLALSAAIKLKDIPGITVLSAGTDGTDGPTDAAGAVVNSGTLTKALSLNEDPINYLAGFDSYNFFRKVGGLIVTGPTYTNVMDIVVVIVE